ncbi:MAG: hypothetical protein ACOY0T_11550 [Myxococcota bacterium]
MPTLPASLPLVSYAESLCTQARVLLVGNALSGLARHLLERGARLVYVCDRNAARRAEAQARGGDRNIVFGSLEDGPAALRENFFDFVLIENLALEPDARATLSSVARLMTARASALVVAPNPESTRPLLPSEKPAQPLDYYALYDAVTAVLPKVRMLGQVPFVGYAVVDFSAEGDPSPVLDTSLTGARGEEPDYFIALAGRETRSLDEYAVMQLRTAEVIPESAPESVAPPKAPLATPAAPVAPAAASTSLNKGLEQKLLRQEAWINELEARAATADERADAAESELDEVRERLGELEQRHERDCSALGQERDALKAELERLRQRVNDQDDLIALKDTQLSALADDGEATRELDRLEAQLKERGERVLTLEREVVEAERIGRELLRKANAGGSAASQQLAEQLARAEAELLTLRWSLDLAKRHARSGFQPS